MWEIKLKKILPTTTASRRGQINLGSRNDSVQYGSLHKGNSLEIMQNLLTSIRGINKKTSQSLLDFSGISYNSRFYDIKQRNLEILYNKLTELRKNNLIDDKLKEFEKERISHYMKLNTIRGLRHKRKLPQKGRTRSNAKTRKIWKIT